MTTMFPKSYILERIDARIASLARQGVEDAAVIVRANERERVLVIAWLAKLARAAEDISLAAHEQHDVLEATTIAPDDLITQARKLTRDLPSPPYVEGYYNSDTPDGKLFSARRHAVERLKLGVREANDLEHARAYLMGTPVDEYTLTSLTKLGLLEAVKFSLDAARAEARKADR